MPTNPYEPPQNAAGDASPIELSLRERLANRNRAILYAMAVAPGLLAVCMAYFMVTRIRHRGWEDARLELPVYLVMGFGVVLFGSIAAVLIWRALRIGRGAP